MPRFCFIHCADLHLDTPFACAHAESPQVAEALREATFQAWDRVVSACIERRAAFLLVAGDVFDATLKSLRAQLRFREGLERLDQKGIPAFVAHGNHDPLDSVSASLPPPPSTHVFGAEVETREVRRDGELLARVTGVSHPRKNESRNLAKLFPAPEGGVFEAAVLHCNAGAETGHDVYAPCDLEDLTGAGYGYWALGHVHERRILNNRAPWVVYPGNTQGRSLREPGARGCLLVEVENRDVVGEPKVIETDAVRWYTAEVEAEPFASTQDLIDGLLEKCRGLQQDAAGRPVVARLIVRGRTPLYRELRRPGHAADLEEALRERTASWPPLLRVAVLEFALRPPLDLEALVAAPDFLGELLRSGGALTAEDCLAAWAPLLEDRRFSHFGLGPVLESLDWREAAEQARYLCADLLSQESPE